MISHHDRFEKKEQQQENNNNSNNSSSKIGETEEHINTRHPENEQSTTADQGETKDGENVDTSIDTSHPHSQHTKGEETKKKTNALFGKFKEFFRKYGPLGVIIYFGIYLITLFGIFLLLDSGVINAADVIEWIRKLGLDKWVDMEDINTRRTANFALAWILTKFTEPLRFAITLFITPMLFPIFSRFAIKMGIARFFRITRTTK